MAHKSWGVARNCHGQGTKMPRVKETNQPTGVLWTAYHVAHMNGATDQNMILCRLGKSASFRHVIRHGVNIGPVLFNHSCGHPDLFLQGLLLRPAESALGLVFPTCFNIYGVLRRLKLPTYAHRALAPTVLLRKAS